MAGVARTTAYQVSGEVLLQPGQSSVKFETRVSALLAATTFTVATLGLHVVANFVSPILDFAQVFPRRIGTANGGPIAALTAPRL